METQTRDSLVREAREHFSAQRLAEAEAAADKILEIKPSDFDGHFFKGFARLFDNDPARALRHFDCAALVDTAHPFVESARGKALRALGRMEEAKASLEAAVSINAEFGDAWMMLGETYEDLADFALAERAFRKASAIAPFEAQAFAKLSALREKAGDLDTAKAAARRALEHEPDGGAANIAWTSLALDRGEHDEVIERLEARVTRPDWSEVDRAEGYGLLAEARQAKGEIDTAYGHFEQANEAAKRAFADRLGQNTAGYAIDEVKALRAAVAGAPVELWTEDDPGAPGGPIFIVGFARSGTTLLDQILASHSQIAVVEESASLDAAWAGAGGEFEPGAMVARLATQTTREAGVVRDAYREALTSQAGDPPKPVIVDRYAMHLVRAPLIRALWPNARFIFVQRDPRDAVLSAFQRRFAITPATEAMVSLQSAAAYYDATVGLFHALTERAPCRVHTVRYEGLLDDFKGEVSGLLSFLGLEWEARVQNYRRSAASRPVRTASARQVIKPLYETSRGRWRAYERQMADILPVLEPWASRLGYETGQ